MFPLRYLNGSAIDSLNQIFNTYAYTQMFIYTEIERISLFFPVKFIQRTQNKKHFEIASFIFHFSEQFRIRYGL